MKQTKSGSPAAQLVRKKEYKARSGRVSNPGQPSPVNREARRRVKRDLYDNLKHTQTPRFIVGRES